jgi:hypothetical protein
MTTIAISMFHDEADVAGPVVRHMLAECDAAIVADNNSADGSRAILDAIGDPRLTILDEPSFAYNQASTMNRLVALAAAAGAEWVVPFDFDEWWYAEGGRIADVLAAMPEDMVSTTTRTWDMIPQPDDPDDPDPFARVRWTRPGSLWSLPHSRKTAFRPAPDRILLQGNHGLAGYPWADVGPLRIRHVPFRSLAQATAKLRHGRAAVIAAGLPGGSGSHWQQWGSLSDEDLSAWWAEWTDPAGLELWTP